MGWGDCGINPETDEPMGYAHSAVCHAAGCTTPIDHGLSYVCGSMHQGGEHGCGYYFCGAHLIMGGPEQLCASCLEEWERDAAELHEHRPEDHGVLNLGDVEESKP
jgi:hypothetical protein